MRVPHTQKFYIPNRDKFDKALDIYQKMYGVIPVKTRVIRGIISHIIGWKIEYDLLDFEGRKAYVLAANGTFTILVSRSTPTLERRSDIAHELAHILHSFEPDGNRMINIQSRMSKEESHREEQICDEIGANLLCPEWAIDKQVVKAVEEIPDLTRNDLLAQLSQQLRFPKSELNAHLLRHYNGLSLDQGVIEGVTGQLSLEQILTLEGSGRSDTEKSVRTEHR